MMPLDPSDDVSSVSKPASPASSGSSLPDDACRSAVDIQSVQRWRKAGILVGGLLLVVCAALVTSWP
ncbi:MAG: isoprenylcysteine carboxylmethyltransferase family protein, partial [Alphaproteobacteria bacterium]|nr:isoprenylcysteine carboxylmethyltransferase family protein [Alphaproteobacteria bacterium]